MKVQIVVCLSLAIMVCGCGPKAKTTGFLSDYSKLQRESDTRMRYINNEVAATYSGFIVDPVQTRFYSDKKKEGKLKPEQIKKLTDYMHEKIVEAIKESGLKVANQPAVGVARIRVALTSIEKTDMINMLPQASLLGVGVGGATMEGEVVDSITGRQIAAVVQSRQGSRIPFTNLGDFTSAKNVMDEWAKNFQKKLEEMQGKK